MLKLKNGKTGLDEVGLDFDSRSDSGFFCGGGANLPVRGTQILSPGNYLHQ